MARRPYTTSELLNDILKTTRALLYILKGNEEAFGIVLLTSDQRNTLLFRLFNQVERAPGNLDVKVYLSNGLLRPYHFSRTIYFPFH